MMELVEELNRTVKLALDDGRVASLAEAQALFEGFRLRIVVGSGFAKSPAGEAAVLTLLVAAPKTFLGGVEIVGAVDERCTLAWFADRPLAEVAHEAGARVGGSLSAQASHAATIHVNDTSWIDGPEFSISLQLSTVGFVISPDEPAHTERSAPVEVGVAAAGAALSEAFAHVYRRSPMAGQRRLSFRMPGVAPLGGNPVTPTWVVGLGHLGQAFLWTLALARNVESRQVRLTDFDKVSASSLSTCLLVKSADIGKPKVQVVGDRLRELGFAVELDMNRLNLDVEASSVAPVAVVAVDNIALRRSLDRLRSARVFECGIGTGTEGFTRVQLHAFPGPRLARDIWAGEDPDASRLVDISAPAYQALLKQSRDECGTTLLAGRAIATPFVGAFAGALLFGLAMSDREQHLAQSAWAFDLSFL